MTLPTGIRRLPSGRYQVRIRLGGVLYAKGFPADASIEEMVRWRQARYYRAALNDPDPDLAGPTFAADCARYLQTVTGMPSYRERAYHIGQWQAALGGSRSRQSITAVDLRDVLARWKAKLSPASLNRRRTALMHLWTTLDGHAAPNPVKDVPRLYEPVPVLRLPSLEAAERAIAAVGTDAAGQAYPKKGRRSRARLRVLLWTGWPPAQLMQMTAADVDVRSGHAYVSPRRKGTGARGRRLPVTPQALAALQDLDAADGWGRFSTHSLRKTLHAGCDTAGVPRFRLYDLRHLFLTLVAAASKDDRAVAELALHTSPAQTRRYTTASVDARMADALAAVAHATFARDSEGLTGTFATRPKRGRRQK